MAAMGKELGISEWRFEGLYTRKHGLCFEVFIMLHIVAIRLNGVALLLLCGSVFC